MWKTIIIAGVCLGGISLANPLGLKRNMGIVQEDQSIEDGAKPEMSISKLNLPSNATSIRADITDGFTCENKTYGYYADVENDCQIFHVCLPVTYADGKENTFRWSFICPEETVFSQDSFTCMRSEDMSIECEESFKYYELNRNFGMTNEETMDETMNTHSDELEDVPKQPTLVLATADKEQKGSQTSMGSMVDKKDQKKETPNKGQITNKRKTPSKVNMSSNKKKVQATRKGPVATTTVKTIIDDNVESESQIVRKKFQPIRKAPIPTVASTTTPKSIENDNVEDVEVAATTTIKYPKFTRRPEINKDQKKPETNTINKRKRPEVQVQTEAPVNIEKDSPITDKNQKLPLNKIPLVAKPIKKTEQNLTEVPALPKPEPALVAEKTNVEEKVESKPETEDPNSTNDKIESIKTPEPTKEENNSMITEFIASLINNENAHLEEELKHDEMMLKAEKAAEAMAQENQEILTINGDSDNKKQVEPIDLVFEDNITPALEAINSIKKEEATSTKSENTVEMPSPVVVGQENSKPENSKKTPMHSFSTNNMSEMLHIPVRIIHDEDPTVMNVPTAETLNKEPVNQMMHSFSIDDIVELVKESVESANEKQKLASKGENNLMAQSAEILPIYNRIPSPMTAGFVKPEELSTSMSEPTVQDDVVIKIPMEKTETSENVKVPSAESDKVPSTNTVLNKNSNNVPVIDKSPVPLVAKKSNNVKLLAKEQKSNSAARTNGGRSLNSEQMNPRKRRFMFRADVS